MRKLKSASVLILLLAPSLTACAGQVRTLTEIKYVRQELPAALLECSPEPAAPTDTANNEAVANYVYDGIMAGRDCRESLGAVRRLVTPK